MKRVPLSEPRMLVKSGQYVLEHLRRAVEPVGEAGDGQLLEAFLIRRDEAAFAALLRRHGPMVWGVCRRLAGQEPDAEDAFQAVFLILVRNANRVWPRDRVGAWLHGVAFRTARKARRLADRRRAREKQLRDFPHPSVDPILPNGDLNPILDEELSRLPEKFRVPVLLCDLEGRSQRDVARELQLPVGTLCHRLASARQALARRLARRGVTLAIGALAAAVVPRSLAAVTRRAALGLAAGRELASLVPPQIVALIEGVSAMTPNKFRLGAVLVLACVLGGLGLGLRQQPTLVAGENDPPAVKQPAAAAEPATDDRTFLRRLSLDLRGILPTEVEMNYFLADRDTAKRRKVAAWMLGETWKTAERERLLDKWDRMDAAREIYKGVKIPEKEAQALAEWLAKDPSGKSIPDDYAKTYKSYIEELQNHLAGQPPKPADSKAPQVEDLLKEALKFLQSPTDPNNPQHAKRRAEVVRLLMEAIQQQSPKIEAPNKVKEYEAQYRRALEFLGQMQKPPTNEEEAKRHQERLKREIEFLQQLQKAQPPDKPVESPMPPPADPKKNADDVDRLLSYDQFFMLGLTKKQELTGIQSDAEFLRRTMLDITGSLPTIVEMKYFIDDKDPNKRSKVIDWMLQSRPEAAKRWRQMQYERSMSQALTKSSHPVPDRFNRLLGELLAGSRSDTQILESLTLATLARFPTDTERPLLLESVQNQKDRRKAWDNVLSMLLNTQEFRQHVSALTLQAATHQPEKK